MRRLWTFDDINVGMGTGPDGLPGELTLRVRRNDGAAEASYRWRLDMPHVLSCADRRMPQPRWDGTALAGRRLLICCDQGFGDVLQYVRYLPQVRSLGATIIVECRPELLGLLEGQSCCDTVFRKGGPVPAFDTHCQITELGGLVGRRAGGGTAAAYLEAPARNRILVQRPPERALAVGLIWAGNPRADHDRHRSVTLDLYTPLLARDDVAWFSLQHGERESDLRKLGLGGRVHPLGDRIEDFTDLADAMRQLDLIITVDSAPAHLAGALGRPVWTVLSTASCWRWGIRDQDTPLYPTMRLFRQKSPGDWSAIAEELLQALSERLGRKSPSSDSIQAPSSGGDQGRSS